MLGGWAPAWCVRAALLVACMLLASPVPAFRLGFSGKRFREDGLLHAGSLGLGDVDGYLGAWGYYNDDRLCVSRARVVGLTAASMRLWWRATGALYRCTSGTMVCAARRARS